MGEGATDPEDGGGDSGFLPVAVATFFFFFGLFRVTPVANGNSQARCQIRAVAAGLHHSHSNTGSKLPLQPTLQLTATPDA